MRVSVGCGHADFFALIDIKRPLAYRAAPSPAFRGTEPGIHPRRQSGETTRG